jgi:hypothetical protein
VKTSLTFFFCYKLSRQQSPCATALNPSVKLPLSNILLGLPKCPLSMRFMSVFHVTTEICECMNTEATMDRRQLKLLFTTEMLAESISHKCLVVEVQKIFDASFHLVKFIYGCPHNHCFANQMKNTY